MVDQSQIDALLQQGIAAAKAGQTEQAQQFLMRVVELDETHVRAWLWLSSVVDDPVDKFTCLQNVLALDPDNKPAQKGLTRLEQDVAASQPAVPPAAKTAPPPLPEPEQQEPVSPSSPHHDEISPAEPAQAEKTGGSRYKRLSPKATPPESSPSRPAHLREHASTAGALLKNELSARASKEQPQVETTITPDPQPDVKESRIRKAYDFFVEAVTTDRRFEARITIIRATILLLGLCLCSPCAVFGGISAFKELGIRYQGVPVEAHLIDYRVTRNTDGFEVYEVKYKFSLDGEIWYSQAGDEDDIDLYWVSMPRADWDAARKTKRLRVLYLSFNPGANRPSNPGPHEDTLATSIKLMVLGIAVGLAVTMGGISWTMILRRRKPVDSEAVVMKRHQRSAEPDESQTSTGESKPRHLQAYASMASALIQQKSAAQGLTPVDREEAEVPESRGGARCPFCRSAISVMATECDVCHLPLVVDCPSCDSRIDVELAACPSCGQTMRDFRNKSAYFAGLGAAYQAQQKHRNAIRAWEIVQMLDPHYPELRLRLAEALSGADRPNRAIDMLKTVLEEEQGQEAASLMLGKLYHNLSYWDDAEEVYREALAVSPESAKLNYALGWLFVDHGRAKKGFEHILRATELDPEYGLAWFRSAQLYDVMHKPKQAAHAYRQAVQFLPEGSLAYKKALHQTSMLDPELPQVLSTGWAEFVRQAAGPFLVCVIAVLLDSGLRPWWIPIPGWMALFAGIIGVTFWVSGISLPKNPAICWMLGAQGLPSHSWRIAAIVIGAFFWLLAMGIILYPIGQSVPEVPEWILNS